MWLENNVKIIKKKKAHLINSSSGGSFACLQLILVRDELGTDPNLTAQQCLWTSPGAIQ